MEQSAFKFPKPVDEPPVVTTPAPTPHSPLEINTEEPHSPKKLDSKFAYINALNSPRKRIRTESMTSNKSYSDVSLKSRKTIKQEESQKASDAKRDLRKRLNNIQNVDKQSLTMFDMIYYNPAKNPMKTPAPSKKGSVDNSARTIDRESRSVSKSRSPTPAPSIMPPPVEPPSAPPPVQLTPQIKLGPNGEMILDEASLVVENEREKAMRDSLAKTEVVYVDEFSGNSGYYSRYKRTRDWPPEETIRFYRCLHTIGTDFSMMIQLFPNRTRRDLKLKFKKEERLNLKLINKALLFPKEFNIEELRQQFQEEDEEIERQREQERQVKAELEEKLKQQKLSKKLQMNQSKNRNPKKKVSKSARVLVDIEEIANAEALMDEAVPKRKRKDTRKEQRSVPITEPKTRSRKRTPKALPVAEETDDDEPIVCVSDVDEPSGATPHDKDQVSQVDSVPYIPNGDFQPVGTTEDAEPQKFTESSSNEPSESHLNIEAMDIDIVDEQSKSLYAIKAEPAAYPVQIFESPSTASLATSSIVTLQDLDNSETTVTYQRSKTSGSDQDLGIDSIESKYYGGCEIVYLNNCTAAVTNPVKTESTYCATQLHPESVQSPPLQYDLHTIHSPDFDVSRTTVKSDIQESTTSQETCSDINPDPNSPDETNPSSESIQTKPEVDLGESPTEDSNDCHESEYSEDQMEEPVQCTKSEEQLEPEEEPRGLGPLEDIDINSLVLVESQDTNDPTRTIYEIYVTNPETGKLSEKPLDVPEDVIENIRSILEGGEE
ncbi:transcription factor TFIIIB component B'' homolog [Armigeres subalbatus]|uniref:transcription factor TFIIIB component B'' homolog n=1 Tax=Armigeres subalbatus TaxID=124917 RepID=UPI002ED0AF9C